jgi:hypothetical protein
MSWSMNALNHHALIGGQPAVSRLLTLMVAVSAVFAVGADAPPAIKPRMEQVHKEFLVTHCVRCHDAKESNGGVRLDTIALDLDTIEAAERWAKVLAVLNSGEMPPVDEPQPPAAAKEKFLEVLSKQMVVARKALADTGGAITMRRLNRREYVNTIRELLDVEVAVGDLPPDDDGGGFDTVGSGLFFSSDQFEAYVRIGRAALDSAIVTGPQPEKKSQRKEVEVDINAHVRRDYDSAVATIEKIAAWRKSGKPLEESGYNDLSDLRTNESLARGRETVAWAYLNDPATRTGAFVKLNEATVTIPHDAAPGHYMLRMRVAFPADAPSNTTINMTPLLRPKPGDPIPRYLEVGTPGEAGWPAIFNLVACPKVEGTMDRPEVIEIPVELTKGGNRTFGIRQRRSNGAGEVTGILNWYWYYKAAERKKHEFGFWRGLWIDWTEWEGPFVQQWPPRSTTLALGNVDLATNPGETEARQVIERFAERAFRGRPVTPAFVDKLVAHYVERRAAGEPFVNAIKTPLSLVLSSPSFLYILEPQEGEAAADRKPMPLEDAELANRLAYFLWASPPDSRLSSFVSAGTLKDEKTLPAEIDRMLADEKVMRFISGFTHQWLHMKRLDFFQFNFRLYPTFDGSTKESARREVFETVRTVLDEDLPLATLLKSDFVVVDDVLADYYDIPGVRGTEFRKVAVPVGTPRGGLLGMAAILAMGSDGERSSPVERGAWVLRKLLHDPPPPAPANVPQLSRFGDNIMPARELMVAHQEQPQCAQCHRKIDPLGYGLENFDAVGRWREQEYVERYTHHKEGITKKAFFPIDARGQLPDGTQFDGFEGLRDAVAKHDADFARGFIEHLIEYALGRPVSFADEELIATILHNTKAKGYTPRHIIHGIVKSKEFQSK